MNNVKWDGKTERRIESLNIPYPLIGVIFALVLQTVGGVWWASSMNTSMTYLKAGQAEMNIAITNAGANRYTSVDASRDWAVNDRRILSLENNVSDNKRAIIELQIKNGSKQ